MKLHLYLQPLPMCALLPELHLLALNSHRSANPIVNLTCEGLARELLMRNHPQTIPLSAQPVEKLSSTKLIPSAKKVGDH